MDSWDLRTFRNDLSIFIKIIKDEKITGDFTVLDKVLEDINNTGKLEYKVIDMCFNINGRIKGTVPSNLSYYQVYFDNTLKLKDVLSTNEDPLFKYSLELNIHAYETTSMAGDVFKSSWHLDQHYSSTPMKHTHPCYHFQFGGKKIQSIPSGMVSILSTPRIPHPPMDIFLGFHFVLSNFFNSKQYSFVNSILELHDYQEIIKRAQMRLWTPYFGAFGSSNTHSDFTLKNVFPLYLN